MRIRTTNRIEIVEAYMKHLSQMNSQREESEARSVFNRLKPIIEQVLTSDDWIFEYEETFLRQILEHPPKTASEASKVLLILSEKSTK